MDQFVMLAVYLQIQIQRKGEKVIHNLLTETFSQVFQMAVGYVSAVAVPVREGSAVVCIAVVGMASARSIMYS